MCDSSKNLLQHKYIKDNYDCSKVMITSVTDFEPNKNKDNYDCSKVMITSVTEFVTNENKEIMSSGCSVCGTKDTHTNELCECDIKIGIFNGFSDFSINYPDTCLEGPTGPIGPIGPVGPVGPVGPAYIINQNEKTNITVYSLKEQNVGLDQSIVFDMPIIQNGGCVFINDTSEIWLYKKGLYHISYIVNTVEPCQISMVKNEASILVGSTNGTFTGTSQNTNVFLCQLDEIDFTEKCEKSPTGYGCKLEIVNSSSITNSVSLYGSRMTGNVIPQITASMTIMSV